MTNVVVFDPDFFKQKYPQFIGLSNELLEYFFEKSETTMLDNSEAACVPLKERKMLFDLLVAHQAQLQERINDGSASLVGNITSATEGSVSIGVNAPTSSSAMGQWLMQTPYGQEYWVLTAKYRNALYIIENLAMPVDRYRFPSPKY